MSNSNELDCNNSFEISYEQISVPFRISQNTVLFADPAQLYLQTQHNPNLIYALLYKRELFELAAQNPGTQYFTV